MSSISQVTQKKDLQTGINEATAEADTLILQLSNIENEIDECRSTASSSRDECLCDIEDFAQTLNSHLEQLKELAIIKMNKLYQDRDIELASDKDKCVDGAQELRRIMSKLQESDSMDGITKFIWTKTSQKRIKEYRDQSKEFVSRPRKISFSFKRNPLAAQLIDTVLDVGTFQAQSTSLHITIHDVPYENTRNYKVSCYDAKTVQNVISQQGSFQTMIANDDVDVIIYKTDGKIVVTAQTLNQVYTTLGKLHNISRPPKTQFSWSTNAKNVRVYKTEEGIIVKIYQASILNSPVDCITNSANENLSHGGGLAKAIADAAGDALVRDGDDQIRRKGKIPVGSAYTTTAGCLPYECVIHAVGPAWYDYSPFQYDDVVACEVDLSKALMASFREADKRKLSSVALPAISSAIFGVPEEICTYQYALATLRYSRQAKTSPTTLKEIHFIDINYRIVQKIQAMFERIFVDDSRPYDIQKYVRQGK